MNGRKWTEQEIEFLKNNFGTMRTEDIANALGRSYGAVHTYSKRINLFKCSRWEYDDIEFVRENKNKMSYKEIAKHLGRTVPAVRDICYKINDKRITKSKKKKFELSSRKSVFDWLYKNASGLTKNEAIKEIKQLANMEAIDIANIDRDYNAWRKEYMQTKNI